MTDNATMGTGGNLRSLGSIGIVLLLVLVIGACPPKSRFDYEYEQEHDYD